MRIIPSLFIILLGCAGARAADDDGLRLFEQKIRPALVKNCVSCHSVQAREAKKLKGGLYLDSAAGIAAGGESGPVVVKGKSRESLLIKSLRHEGLEMPPSGKLPDDLIADFAKWIDMGAPDPRTGDLAEKPKNAINLAKGREWWAFRPLNPVAPSVTGNPVDAFIRRAQQAAGIKANPPARKERLIRRAYLDLVGLPPSPEQVSDFLADSSPEAFAKVLDSLLASPAYGERWARHWLDAARYAESGGYEFDAFRPGAHHYRDWVIKALNADMPYDEFVRMQLAGDLIKPGTYEGACATGFLVAGPYPGQITAKTVERIRYDQIDDMLMTMGGAMLGLTIGCVRCHEHKFDPIPHSDYYGLASALARTVQGSRFLDTDPAATERALAAHKAAGDSLRSALSDFASKDLPGRFAPWAKAELPRQPASPRWQWLEPVEMEAERSYLKLMPSGVVAHDGAVAPGAARRRRGQPAAGSAEHYKLAFHTHQSGVTAIRIDMFADKSLPQRGPGLNPDGSFQLSEVTLTARPLDPAAKDQPITVKLKPAYAAAEDKGQPLANATDGKPATAWVVKSTAKRDNAAVLEFDSPIAGFSGGTQLHLDMVFKDMGIGRFRVALSTETGPATWAGDLAPQHVSELRAIAPLASKPMPPHLRLSLARWFALHDAETGKVFGALRDHEAAVPRPRLAEVYTTVSGGQDVYFLRRGEVDNKQGKAEPGFVQVLWRGQGTPSAKPGTDPRLALADWMTGMETGAGPLLARVMVNRMWQHHFGKGIVGTPNDFGTQGERPAHPELLEFLASELVRGGWRLKPIHKLMMLSETYRQSHDVNPASLETDPGNRLHWHHTPARLEAEAIRDALLAVGGTLDQAMFGPSVLENSVRRSIYLRVKRSELLPVMTIFDAPEPTASIGERSVTTVPSQALAMMNSPFVRQQAEKLADRVARDAGARSSQAVDMAFMVALARKPTETEAAKMSAFLDQAAADGSPDARRKAMIEVCHTILCINEFVYVD